MTSNVGVKLASRGEVVLSVISQNTSMEVLLPYQAHCFYADCIFFLLSSYYLDVQIYYDNGHKF